MSTAAAALRVVEREAAVFRRLWRGTVIWNLITPLLFLAAIGVGLGSLVDERNAEVDGYSYLVFVTPGLLVASTTQAVAAESLWPIMAGTKWFRTFFAMVATPLGAADVYRGRLAWTAIRSTVTTAGFLLIAALVGGIESPWGVLALPGAVLCGLAFAAPMTAFAATQDTDFSFPVIMRLVILPLFLFSGTFVPIDELPGALQSLAVLSPLWHGVEICRAATTGSIDWLDLAGHTAVLVGCVAVGWQWGVRTFARKLAP